MTDPSGRNFDQGRGRVRRGLRRIFSPASYFPAGDIHDGALLISELLNRIRANRKKRRKVRLDDLGRFDIAAMALDACCTPQEIERRLANRLIQSRRNVLAYLALGIFLLAVWGWDVCRLSSRGMSQTQLALSVVVAICFFLLAFYNALINWHIRTRQLGSVRDFLLTEDSWWPN